MLTRCPSCATHFRVTAEQIKARSGRVRCGACQHAFNALDSLIEEPGLVFAPTQDSLAEHLAPEEPRAAGEEPTGEDQALVQAPPPDAAPAGAEAPAAAEPIAPDAFLAEADLTAQPSTEAEASSDVAPQDPFADEAPRESDDWASLAEQPPPPRRWPWVIGSLLALAVLGLQALFAFRVELAVLWPESKPILLSLCDAAGCEIGLPTKVGLVGIEASDLHPDTERKGRLALTATLKNRAPFAQQFPHLELTLTDTADKAIARKVLAPADYLPPGNRRDAGMPSNADITVAVTIDAAEMPASGYRLYLFYP